MDDPLPTPSSKNKYCHYSIQQACSHGRNKQGHDERGLRNAQMEPNLIKIASDSTHAWASAHSSRALKSEKQTNMALPILPSLEIHAHHGNLGHHTRLPACGIAHPTSNRSPEVKTWLLTSSFHLSAGLLLASWAWRWGLLPCQRYWLQRRPHLNHPGQRTSS